MSSLIHSSGLTSYAMPNGLLDVSTSAGALTGSLKTAAGNAPSAIDPLFFAFRRTASSGALYEGRHITTPVAVTISPGSTLGQLAGVPVRVWFVVFDDAGTPRLAARCCSSEFNIFALAEFGTANATQDGGAGLADTAGQFWASVDITGKPFRLIGFVDWDHGLTTAGTWTATDAIGGAFKVQMKGPGIPSPGESIPQAFDFENSFVSTPTTIPWSTIAAAPTNTSGAAFLSNSFIPFSVVNFVENHCILQASCSVAEPVTMGLFKDSDPVALNSASARCDAIDKPVQLIMTDIHRIRGNADTLTTYTIRAGAHSGTFALNGTSAALVYGNVTSSIFKTSEIMA